MIKALIGFTPLNDITEFVNSLGALSTGLAAIFAAFLANRSAKKKAMSECDQRIAELGKSFHAGIKLADSRPRRRKGDSL